MSHVMRASYEAPAQKKSPAEVAQTIGTRKWQTVEIKISEQDLEDNIDFLDDAVFLRASSERVPLMTTTGIYGPIKPFNKVALTPGEGTGVSVIEEYCP